MRPIFYFLLVTFLFASLPCLAQSANNTEQPEPDIKKLSIAELVHCFDTPGACGDNDDWSIADEIARRKYLSPLLKRYWKEPKQTIRRGIEYVAYRFDTPEVTAFMQKVIASRVDDGEDRYYPVNYLAKKCDRDALHALSSNDYSSQGGMQYATSMELFGKCGYRPAIPQLVSLLSYSDLNIVIAAGDSLDRLYPDHPKFNALSSVQRYYCARAHKEGFTVDCEHFSDAPQSK